jgi:excisionase family DNA binding protein
MGRPVPGFYTTHEAARLLGVSLPTVVNWIRARRIKAHRTPGGHRRISHEELAAFMLRHGMPLPAELSSAVEERRKALVIADSGPAREGLARQLAAAGWAVEQASPGFAAGAATARFEPDVVVLDSRSADGGDPLRDLLADRDSAEIPVLAVGKAEWAERLAEAGCAGFVARPLKDGAVCAAAAQLLASPLPGKRRRP